MLDKVNRERSAGHRDRGQTVLQGELLDLDRRLDAIFTGWAQCWNAREYRFPACIEARHLDRLDYFHSFPHLATFPVTLEGDKENIERFAASDPCSREGNVTLGNLGSVEHVLTPAACYHVYVELEGAELDAPCYITTRATCFRNEAEYTPLERQWNFSMREIVCLGTISEVEDFLLRTTRVINHFCTRVGLPVEWEGATDPFFSPASNPKYLFQKLEPVKRELVVDGELAIASTNLHHDYFGETFDILRDDGPAVSGCVAFGMERWLAAFLRAYGDDSDNWPALEGVAA